MSVATRFFKSAVFGGGIKLASVGLTFLVTVVLARSMTAAEFGVYASTFSLALVVGSALNFGQHRIIQRFWPSVDQLAGVGAADAVFLRALKIVTIGVSALLVLILIFCAINVEFKLFVFDAQLLMAGGLLSCAVAYAELLSSAWRAKGAIAISLLPRDFFWRLLVIIFALYAAPPVDAIFVISASSLILFGFTLLQLIALYRGVGDNLPLSVGGEIPTSELDGIRHAQIGLWATSMVSPAVAQAGTIVVAFTLGPADAGAFFVAQRFANLLSIVLLGSNLVAAPLMSRAWFAGYKNDVQILVSGASLIATSAAFFGLVLYGFFGEFILGLMGGSYRSAYQVLLILSVAQVVSSLCGPNGTLLLMAGYERVQLKIMLLTGVIGVALTAIGAVKFGLIGAALGGAFGVILWNVLASQYCAKQLKINPFRMADLYDFFRLLYGRFGVRQKKPPK